MVCESKSCCRLAEPRFGMITCDAQGPSPVEEQGPCVTSPQTTAFSVLWRASLPRPIDMPPTEDIAENFPPPQQTCCPVQLGVLVWSW